MPVKYFVRNQLSIDQDQAASAYLKTTFRQNSYKLF